MRGGVISCIANQGVIVYESVLLFPNQLGFQIRAFSFRIRVCSFQIRLVSESGLSVSESGFWFVSQGFSFQIRVFVSGSGLLVEQCLG